VSKKVVLSTGFTIEAYVGDGFDGASGVYFKAPEGHPDRHKQLDQLTVPKQDAYKVAQLLDWYQREEMKLRRSEGLIYCDYFSESIVIDRCSNPYLATFFAGNCFKLAGRKHK